MVSRHFPPACSASVMPAAAQTVAKRYVQCRVQPVVLPGSLTLAILRPRVQDLGHAREDQPDRTRQEPPSEDPLLPVREAGQGTDHGGQQGRNRGECLYDGLFLVPPIALPVRDHASSLPPVVPACRPVITTRARSERRARTIIKTPKTFKVDVRGRLSRCGSSSCTPTGVCGVWKGSDLPPSSTALPNPEYMAGRYTAGSDAGTMLSRHRRVCGTHVPDRSLAPVATMSQAMTGQGLVDFGDHGPRVATPPQRSCAAQRHPRTDGR